MSSGCRNEEHRHWSGVRRAVGEDILRFLNKSPENQAAGDTLRSRTGAFLTPGLLALFLHRVGHLLYVRGWRRLARLVTSINAVLHKVDLPAQSCIGAGCHLPHPMGVTFFGRAGTQLTLYSLAICCPRGAPESWRMEDAPTLEDGVTVGARGNVIGRVRIGSGSRIFCARIGDDVAADRIVFSRAIRNTCVKASPQRSS